MPALLRSSRLVCFYCGGRSAQYRSPNLQKWQCEKCEAENYLDANGEITDPPPPPENTNARYAQAITRPESPVYQTSDSPLFCQTCQKNQLIFTQALAQFYPSPNESSFGEYERQEKDFREGLEDRYPQVCEDCCDRVNARLKASRYATNTENVRLFLEESRNDRAVRPEDAWKRLLISIAGLLWALSLIGQLLWSGFALLKTFDRFGWLEDPSFSSCYRSLRFTREHSPSCFMLTNSQARTALVLGLLTIWWNPGLQEKIGRKYARLVGLSEFYRLQFLSLAIRVGAYYWTTHRSDGADLQMVQGLHLFVVVSTVLCSIISFHTVTVKYKHRVPFKESPPPLRPRQRQFVPVQPNANIAPPTFAPRGNQSIIRPHPFSINDLTGPPQSFSPLSHQPPTPPPDLPDEGSMDWTPTQPAFQPDVTPVRQNPGQNQQISPFYGRLPPNPVSQEQRLRNPPNKPTFRAASAAKKQNFFNRTSGHSSHETTLFSETASDDCDSPTTSTRSLSTIPFANPTFFPPTSQDASTGLEGLFNNTFSLTEQPAEIRAAQQIHQARQQQRSQRWRIKPLQMAQCILKNKLTILGLLILASTSILFTYPHLLPSTPNLSPSHLPPLLEANLDNLSALIFLLLSFLLTFVFLPFLRNFTLHPSPTPTTSSTPTTSPTPLPPQPPSPHQPPSPKTHTPHTLPTQRRRRENKNTRAREHTTEDDNTPSRTPTQGLGNGLSGLSLERSGPVLRSGRGVRGMGI